MTPAEKSAAKGSEPRQLVLDLPHRAALGAEDFLVSSTNRQALELIDRWPDWPLWAVVVQGEARSGKSHLANVWRLRSGAERVDASRLDETAIAAFERNGTLLIEDIAEGIADERVLFHLLNLAREHRRSILITSRLMPGELAITLPDLRSRLTALPVATIAPPDDAMLKMVLVKLFSDRQLVVEPAVIDHLVLRIERSFMAAHTIVAEIDQRALATRRRVTRALAAEVLAAGAGGGDTG
jgi:chromosomal replication initiation ATPase DnaA